MLRTPLPTAVVLTVLTALTPLTTSAAGQFGWLRASPLAMFDDVDWEMLRKNARTLLDEAPDGTSSAWENANTGHSGSAKVISTYEEDGRRCRKAEFTNKARGMTGIQTHRLCKVEDGTWKLSP